MNKDEWRQILNKSINAEWRQMVHGDIRDDPDQRDKMDDHGVNWMCCAVGAKLMADLDLPYVADPSIIDIEDQLVISRSLTGEAFELGRYFYDAISTGHYSEAKQIFDDIQAMKLDEVVKDNNCIHVIKKAFANH